MNRKGYLAELRAEIKTAERFDRSNEEYARSRRQRNAAYVAHKTMSEGLIAKNEVLAQYPWATIEYNVIPKKFYGINVTDGLKKYLGKGESKSAAWIDARKNMALNQFYEDRNKKKGLRSSSR